MEARADLAAVMPIGEGWAGCGGRAGRGQADGPWEGLQQTGATGRIH